ncbi:hypothetical protein TNCV_3887071 [Trichonephila clavipes]|nr:hypothetical protein TNCV_3887071 [Trichonephila clavipes]
MSRVELHIQKSHLNIDYLFEHRVVRIIKGGYGNQHALEFDNRMIEVAIKCGLSNIAVYHTVISPLILVGIQLPPCEYGDKEFRRMLLNAMQNPNGSFRHVVRLTSHHGLGVRK